MKLTKSHIEELYKFTRKHYVYHYDVQTELVDHLANDIEQIWVENPKVTFEEARDKSFKKFGIFGFMDVIEAKQKQMNKRYWKIILRFAKEWFTVPKIIITFLVFLLFFSFLQIPFSEYIFLGTILVLITLEMIIVFKVRKNHKKKEVKKEKIFLLEAMIGTTKNGFTGFTFVNLFNIVNLTRFDFSNLNIYWIFVISIVLTLLCILFYVSNYVIPKKAEELLQETYPEYKMIKNL
ncbi:hypothetical protein BW723_05345 [Polaribacter reichenbachii]|uniref:Uncharacterized protein n=1 Tax=Polaribacter reichenbachii TaxID=996801 RepID=A0A1B8TUF4_9FLAO|nr:hypothetical protein [Polaribacter reichenbachii]APZ45754.1 hypothetical protein BW723_05345 [Polaribacter reichenbachii]AUC19616.1 hypothetical protein BTO17_13360 [Polaribacter reichenbachii]OBY63230.1 hypothetical protein LPB301_10365 [Polaribacter reichenbachii]